MDIEGFVRGRLSNGEDEEELKSILAERILMKSRPLWSLTILKMSS